MEIERVALIGLGAVGAMYAYRLTEALGFADVEVIVDPQRKQRYIDEGIFLNGRRYDFNYRQPEDGARHADLALFTTKNNTLDQAMESMAPFIGKHTTILSLLNGLDSEQVLKERFPEAHVLHGFTTALDSTRTANRIDFTNEGTVFIGESDCSKTERVLSVQRLLEEAGIRCNVPEDIHKEMWAKFMVNVSINTVSAICRSSYGQCVAIGPIKDMIIAVQREVVALAQAHGVVGLDESYIERYQKVFASLEPAGKTSMHQDVEAGRQTENRWFCLKASALGNTLHVPTPLCDTLGHLLDGIDRVNCTVHEHSLCQT